MRAKQFLFGAKGTFIIPEYISMDEELNPLQDMLGGNDSQRFPAPTQDHTIRNLGLEIKHPQYLISPANNLFNIHRLCLRSPSPFKNNFAFYDDQNSHFNNFHDEVHPTNQTPRIKNVLNFDESPRKNKFYEPQHKIQQQIRFGSIAFQELRQFNKNPKGLRNLSKCVYRIVHEVKSTTYKEVADQLVTMLNCGQFGPVKQTQNRSKDQQNIKRRVYDALNVLISADVIRRKGKSVIADNRSPEERILQSSKDSQKESTTFNQELQRKSQKIRQKKQILRSLKMKNETLKNIFQRNKHKTHKSEQKIELPFIGVLCHSQINKGDVKLNANKSRVVMDLEQCEVIGDLDLLANLEDELQDQNIEDMMGQMSEALLKQCSQSNIRSIFAKEDKSQQKKVNSKSKQKNKNNVFKKRFFE